MLPQDPHSSDIQRHSNAHVLNSCFSLTLPSPPLPSPPRLIDCFLSESPATTLAFSPTADFLATAHVDDLGVYLWSNKTLFSHVSLRPLPPDYTPSVVDLPTTGTSDDEGGGERGTL